jgi:arabinan endo-1,5-alpha-L-arabinosidase
MHVSLSPPSPVGPHWTRALAQLGRSFLLVLTFLLLSQQARALQGANGSHDPGSLVKEGNKYWMFTTGDGIYAAYSTDLINWTPGPQTIFPIGTWPAWITTAVPGFAGTFWAPECIFMNNKYYMYYSCSTFGSSRSAIGVATSPTLDPSAPNYGWTDLGQVAASTSSTNVNAIDPAVLIDNGRVYMYYGSFSGGLGVLELDPATGLKKAGATTLFLAGNTTSGTRDWEAPYVVKENGFYYFYANRGACCNGLNSTYKIVVGRSTSPTGPFLDKNGVALTATNAQANTQAGVSSVGTLVLGTSGRYIGPGHFGLLRDNGVNLVSMHYYDGTANGAPKLDIANLKYDATNWPIITRDWLPAGRYKITNRNSGLVWDSWGCTANLGETIAQGPWIGAVCQQWDFIPQGNGFYRLSNALNTNRVADLAFCTNANGTTIGIWDWLNNDCQKMKVERAADGSFTFSPAAASNRVIEVPAASTTPGVQLVIWDYTAHPCQKWDIVTAPATWTGAVSNAWNTPGNWAPNTLPTATTDAYIPTGAPRFPVVSTGTATAASLTIGTGATLTLTGGQLDLKGTLTNNGTFTPNNALVSFSGPGSQAIMGSQPLTFSNLTVGAAGLTLHQPTTVSGVLTLTGNLNTNEQPLLLRSDAAGTALVVNNGGVVQGRATMQRYLDPSLNAGIGYRHYASPMTDGTFADLATTGFTPVLNPAYNTAAQPGLVRPYPTVFGYDQTRLSGSAIGVPDFSKGYFSPATGGAMTNGKGYSVYLPATALVAFSGTLATGDVTLGGLGRSAQADAGWHLLGNPYPAPLDWRTLTASNFTNVDPTLYVYRSTGASTGTYRSFVNNVGESPLVAAGQGFFVRVLTPGTPGTLRLTNANRVTTSTTQAVFQRNAAADQRPQVQLALSGANRKDVAYVYFEDGATTGIDTGFDAEKLANPDGLDLASISTTGQSLAINGLPMLTSRTVVPLSLTLPQAGTYTLRADQLANLTDAAVYLIDAATGVTIDLQQQPTYAFTATATVVTGRFSLRFEASRPTGTAAWLTDDLLTVYPNPAQSSVVVGLGAQAVGTCTLFTVLGQTVAVPQAVGPTGTRTLDVRGLPAGTYVLRVQTAAQTLTRRLVIQ